MRFIDTEWPMSSFDDVYIQTLTERTELDSLLDAVVEDMVDTGTLED